LNRPVVDGSEPDRDAFRPTCVSSADDCQFAKKMIRDELPSGDANT
jgi:hypothetical protein